MNQLISVILPVYNGARFLRESIESVVNQSYSNWELIIVDDCSTDETAEIAKNFADNDGRIHYYRNDENLKLPRNLNKGFSLSAGEYLTWTSDDNRFKKNALETMIQALENNPEADLVYASYDVINEKGKKLHFIQADSKAREHILGSNVVGACFLYTRKAYNLTGQYDPDLLYVEDFDYWQRMVSRVRCAAINESLYEYRWHNNSMTKTKNEEAYGRALETMGRKNRPLYDPLSLEQKLFYVRLLKRSYEAQKKKSLLPLRELMLRTLVRMEKAFAK